VRKAMFVGTPTTWYSLATADNTRETDTGEQTRGGRVCRALPLIYVALIYVALTQVSLSRMCVRCAFPLFPGTNRGFLSPQAVKWRECVLKWRECALKWRESALKWRSNAPPPEALDELPQGSIPILIPHNELGYRRE